MDKYEFDIEEILNQRVCDVFEEYPIDSIISEFIINGYEELGYIDDDSITEEELLNLDYNKLQRIIEEIYWLLVE